MKFKSTFYEYKKVLVILLFFAITIPKLLSVPAYPYPIKYKQPDGSLITIQLKGDERVHWAETSDGYTLLSNGKNGWEYAVDDKSGNLKTSGVLAREIGKRTSEETKLLNNLPKKLRFSVSQNNLLESTWEARTGSKKLINTGSFFDSSTKSQQTVDGRKKIFSPNGVKKLILIMIQFPDQPFKFTRQDFVDLMNTQNYNQNGATGSVKDFFYEMSYGDFTVQTDVAPNIYTADHNMAYYGAHGSDGSNDVNAGALMKEAVEKADPDVDFTQYDNDGDGSVDGVYIIYAGYGEASSGIDDTIWPHAGSISGETFDGEKIVKYSCSNELNYPDNSLTTIGVICHEFGHVCGAPDYYDTDYENSGGNYPGTGKWDLMGIGVYNGSKSGNQPAHFNPFEKIRAGWVTPIPMNSAVRITNMPDITSNRVVYKYNTATDGEYYLLENRQQTGFNTSCPGHGLVIYHYSQTYWNTSANRSAPQGFYPVCANSSSSPTTTSLPASYGTINAAGCPFPGSAVKTSFTDESTPSAKSWDGSNTLKPITDISESGGKINFTFINTPALNPILIFNALPNNSTQINLNWKNNDAGNNVIIARNTSSTFGTPTSGTTYTVGNTLSGGGEIIYTGSAESLSDIGLSASTTYYYQIWATDGTNYSDANAANTTTACTSTSVPLFSEGFEGGVLPSCWSQQYVLNAKDWAFQKGGHNGGYGPSSAHTGTKNACLFSDGWTPYITKLITPPIDLSSAAKPVLKFWHTQDYFAGQDVLRVYYRTSLTDTWKQLAIYSNTIKDWTLETIDLPEPSATYYIAFEANANYGYGVCLDDIEVWQDGGDNRWTGTTSVDWFTSTNWSTGVVPTLTNNVEIPSGTPYSPTISGSDATCQNLVIDKEASLSMDGSTARTLTVTGDWTNNGTFNRGVGKVSFKSSSSLQKIQGTSQTDFYTLEVNKSNINNILEATSIIGLKATSSNLSLVGGTLKISSASSITPLTTSSLQVGGTCGLWNNGATIDLSLKQFNLYGTFKNSAGSSSFYFLFPLGSANNVSLEGGTVTIKGYFEPYNPSTDIIKYSQTGGDLLINSSATNVPLLFNSGSSFTMSGGNIIIQKASGASYDYQNSATTNNVTGGTLQIGNTSTSGSPVIRINSTVPVYNLSVNANGTPSAKLTGNDLTVKNNVTLGSGTKLDLNSQTLSIAGNWTNNGGSLGATPSGTVLINGTSLQTIAGTNATTFNNLTLNNSAGLSLSGSVDANINGTLNLSSGVITTGSNKLVIGSTGSVSRTSGHIFGNLQKNVATGSGISSTFEIGDADETAYKPVSVSFANVTTPGSLLGSVSSGNEPNIASSQIDPNNGLNTYWTLTNNGIAFDTYNATFNYLSSDLEGTSTFSDWMAAKYSNGSWTYPVISSRTASAISISNVTSFSNFIFGAKKVMTGLQSGDNGGEIVVYQNNSGELIVKINDLEDSADISVYNTFGQILYKSSTKSGETVIHQSFPSGVYLVSVLKGGKMSLNKVLMK